MIASHRRAHFLTWLILLPLLLIGIAFGIASRKPRPISPTTADPSKLLAPTDHKEPSP